MSITGLSPRQLRVAADLKEQIEGLQNELNAILGSVVATQVATEAPVVSQPAAKRKMTAAWRKALSTAQKARWAKRAGRVLEESKQPAKKASKGKGTASKNAKSEAMKAVWAARRVAKTRKTQPF